MILDGQALAEKIQAEIKALVDKLQGRRPCLAVILVGEHPPSQIYVTRKTQACESVGIISIKRQFTQQATESEILQEIRELNENPLIDAILIQLPLPAHVNPFKITQAVHPDKDVDGFNPVNVGKLLIGETDGFFPCTPLGIKVMLERSGIELTGKHAVVLGRSNIVGKPMAAMLMQSTPGGNATVTIAHKFSRNIKELCLMADLLIVAIGQPKYVKADMVKEGVVIVDVGINRIENPSKAKGFQIVGDVDFENVKDKCSFITPVPKGVGPMTIAMLLQNTLRCYQKQVQKIIMRS